MPIAMTRAAVAAVLNESLGKSTFDVDPVFGIAVPRAVPGVPAKVLHVRETWPDAEAYDEAAHRLARDLAANFARFQGAVGATVNAAGPVLA